MDKYRGHVLQQKKTEEKKPHLNTAHVLSERCVSPI